MSQFTQPPRLATRLVERLIKSELQEEVLGDMEEKFQNVLNRSDRAAANRMYWYQLLNYIRPFALKKISLKHRNHMGIIKHNFLISYRSLLKFRSTFFINLIGLSTGLASAIFIYLWVMDELQTDRFHENDSRLYQVIQHFPEEMGGISTDASSPLLAQALKEEIPEVEKATAVQENWFRKRPGLIEVQDKVVKASEQYIDQDFFNIFSYPLLIGSKEKPLPNNQSVLLSDQLAEKLFGTVENARNKTISWNQDGSAGNYAVSGVFQQPPQQSTRQFDLLFSLDLRSERDTMFSNWYNYNSATYVLIKEGISIDHFNTQIDTFMQRKQESDITLSAVQYADKYLYQNYEEETANGRIEYVKLFSLIAVFILFIACINFMNLTTAKASNRLKEIGVKKAIGARRIALMGQYFSESLLLAFLSLILAVILVLVFLPQFSQLTGKELSLDFDGRLLGGIILITVITGLVAGVYPALYLSKFKPVEVIKGKLKAGLGDTWIRKGLLIFQFAMSVILILSAIIVAEQIDFAQSKKLGFDRDNIVQFEYTAESPQAYQSFLNELRTIPGIVNATGFNHNLTGEYGSTDGLSWEGKDPEKRVSFVALEGGFNLIETLGIEIADGRGFKQTSDNNDTKIILNESAVRTMDISDPVGKSVNLWGTPREIIGVVKDFHFASLYEDIQPAFIRVNPFLNKTMVKIKAGTETQVLAAVQNTFNKRMPGLDFEFTFLDEDFQKMYAAETQVSSLARSFAILSIIISCLGLLGLTFFTLEKRAKEISIRKILGSSGWNTVLLLSSDFTKMVALALVIALPIGYILADQWLGNFVYSVPLRIGYFVIAALSVLMVAWLTIGIQFFRATQMNPAKSLRSE